MLRSADNVRQRRPFVIETSDPGCLLAAWRAVRSTQGMLIENRSAAHFFARGPDTVLADLRSALLAGRYHPSPLFRRLIPKDETRFRAIVVPTIVDRIVQVAAAGVLSRRVNHLFSDASYAYRRGRSPQQAAARLMELLLPGGWVVIADIERFFDNVEHDVMYQILKDVGVDDGGVRLIDGWLKAPVMDGDDHLQPIKGLPQGAPISPVLANLYLTAFDRVLETQGWPHVRYADDFVIVVPSEDQAQKTVAFVREWLQHERLLRIHDDKTLAVAVEEGVPFVGFKFTPGRCWIADSKIKFFRQRVSQLLDQVTQETLADTARRHNDLVQGWRVYYSGGSREIDCQIEDLESWRFARVRRCCERLDVPHRIQDLAFASLTTPRQGAISSPAGYPEPVSINEPASLRATAGTDPWHETLPALSETHEAFASPSAISLHVAMQDQLPLVLKGGVLSIPTHGAFLTRRGSVLSVRKRGHVIHECIEDEIEQVIISGRGTTVSSGALLACADRAVPVVFCNPLGKPLVRATAVTRPDHPMLLDKQVILRGEARGGELAIAIIAAKLGNQRSLLLYHSKYKRRPASVRARLRKAAQAINEQKIACTQLTAAPPTILRTRLFLIEARAAAHYWGALGCLVPDHWHFPGRRHRGATDPANGMLNYGYWVLQLHIWRALEGVMLNPYLGCLHTSRRGGPGLVFDCMEEFRAPIVDRTVLAVIGRRMRIRIRRDGRLSTGTRRRIDRALDTTLTRPLPGQHPPTLRDQIRLQVERLRSTVLDEVPYHGYKMRW